MDQQKDQPSPVWAGAQDDGGRSHGVTGQQGATGQGVSGQDAGGVNAGGPNADGWSAQGTQHQDSRGWGAPVPDGPSAGWGTTPDRHQGPESGSGWGAPQQYPANNSSGAAEGSRRGTSGWTGTKAWAAGGAAAVLAAAAGAGAYAAVNGAGASGGNNAQGAGVPGQLGATGPNGMAGPGGTSGMTGGMGGMNGGMDGGMGGGPGGLGMGMAGLNAAIHSEYVVLQDSGYATMAGQAGTVTSISADSLTVKSEDGFTRTYAVGPDVQVMEGLRQRGGGTTGTSLGLSDVASGATVRVTALKDGDAYTVKSIQLSASTSAAAPGTGTTTN